MKTIRSACLTAVLLASIVGAPGATAAGSGVGAGDDASREDHGRNTRSTAATRTTAPIATHSSECDALPGVGTGGNG